MNNQSESSNEKNRHCDHNILEIKSLSNRIYLLEKERSKLIKSKDILLDNFTRLATLSRYEVSKLLENKKTPSEQKDVEDNPTFLDPLVPKIAFKTFLKYLYSNRETEQIPKPFLNGLITNKSNDGSSSSSLSSSSESETSSSASSLSNNKNTTKKIETHKESPPKITRSDEQAKTSNKVTKPKSSHDDRSRLDGQRSTKPSKEIMNSLKRTTEATMRRNRSNERYKRSSAKGRFISEEERRRIDKKYERMESEAVRNHDRMKQMKRTADQSEDNNNVTVFSRRMTNRVNPSTDERKSRTRDSPERHTIPMSPKNNENLVCDVLQTLANHHNMDLDEMYREEEEPAYENKTSNVEGHEEKGLEENGHVELEAATEADHSMTKFDESQLYENIRSPEGRDEAEMTNDLQEDSNCLFQSEISVANTRIENKLSSDIEEGEAISDEGELDERNEKDNKESYVRRKSIEGNVRQRNYRETRHGSSQRGYQSPSRKSLSPMRNRGRRYHRSRSASPPNYRDKRIRHYSPHLNRDLPDHLKKRLSTPIHRKKQPYSSYNHSRGYNSSRHLRP